MRTVQGIGAGPGYAVGHVYMLAPETRRVPVRHLPKSQLDREIKRFDEAVQASVAEIDSLLQRIQERGSEGAAILKAHQLILEDEMLVEGTRDLIHRERLNAEAALERTLGALETAFANLQDEYFKERGSDLRVVVANVMANLMGSRRWRPRTMPAGVVIVAHELSPAQTMELTSRRLGGFITEVGGSASHSAIMARAMEIPAVVGAQGILSSVTNGQWVAIDGDSGVIVLDPDRETVSRYREARRQYRARENELLANRDEPAVTLDGVRVRLLGNVEYLAEIDSLVSHGGEGIGLFRTEYLFFRDRELPDEETQYEEYRQILDEISPRPATLRTLDIGVDKVPPALAWAGGGDNPALGLRGVRFTLHQRSLMRTQLRALLRASIHGQLRLLIPFVTDVNDIRAVRALLAEVVQELTDEGIEHDPNVPVGAMVELPSAAMVADLLAAESDFLSLGTNDLVQYTLAVDRDNENVASFYQPLHPAVLRLIERTATAGREAGIEVSICGEMAGVPYLAPVLIGCGLTTFSMNPVSIPHVKDLISRCHVASCQALADELMALSTVDSLKAHLNAFHERLGHSGPHLAEGSPS